MNYQTDLVEVAELAATLRVSVTTIRNWVRSGQIPPSSYVKAGRTYRFITSEVIEALRASRMPEPEKDNPELPLGVAAPDFVQRTPIKLYIDTEEKNR